MQGLRRHHRIFRYSTKPPPIVLLRSDAIPPILTGEFGTVFAALRQTGFERLSHDAARIDS